jgi:hypothetical protein
MARVLNGVPIRDSRPGETYPLVVHADDPGVRDDPRHCIFAECAVHNMRSPKAWVGYENAVFGLPLPGGGIEYVRFHTPKRASDVLRAYDDHGTPIPAGIYVFLPLKPSARQEAKSIRNRSRPNGNAIAAGSRPSTGNRAPVFRRNAPRGTYAESK